MRAHTITTKSRPGRRPWHRFLALALGICALGVAASASAAQADEVTNWNEIASTAITAPPPQGQPPHAAQLSLAMVQGAVYDAVNAIDGGHQPYLVAPQVVPGASKEAAAATAAHDVLVALFPLQQGTLDGRLATSLAPIPEPAKSGGIEVGAAAAVAMYRARCVAPPPSETPPCTANDGRFSPFTVIQGDEPGEWRSTSFTPPPNPVPVVDPAPWVGNVRPFLVQDVEMLRSDGPNALKSAAYAEDFNEVKELGSLTSTSRTADQTAASIFWQDSGPAIWNRVFRALAVSEHLDSVESARLLAMTNLAGADGSIGCWNDKYYWNFWRPITAIREAGSDGNPATEADPAWLPLFNPSVPVSGAPLVTPPFPDHPSGHTCISGAIVHALQAFFGTDRIAFTASSNKCSPAPCPPRSFDRFSEALKEIIDVRVWSGIHFRTADVQGAVLGKKVAHYLQKHYFQPTG